MKVFTLFLAAVLALGTTFCQAQEEGASQDRAAFEKCFEAMIQNAQNGLAKSATDKFAIASVAVPITTGTTVAPTVTPTNCNLGVKIWFQLEDGTCFNPAKRKMGVKEKFYVNVQTAVPVYVSLFQNYPDNRPESRQVYPDAKYPESFKVMQTAQITRLPVLFEMDDDTRDEIMSMVVVRADAPVIQPTLSTQAVSSVTSSGGVTVVTAQATAATSGTMKSINDQVNAAKSSGAKDANAETKFNISAPAATVAVVSTVPEDVAYYMFGAGSIGQWQLTLRK